jgi:hypothetical protein
MLETRGRVALFTNCLEEAFPQFQRSEGQEAVSLRLTSTQSLRVCRGLLLQRAVVKTGLYLVYLGCVW